MRLPCSLNLLAVMVADSGGGCLALVSQLLSLDVLPLLASVMNAWLARLRADQQQFGSDGGSGGASARPSASPDSWRTAGPAQQKQQQPQQEQPGAAAGAAASEQTPAAVGSASEACLPAAAAASPPLAAGDSTAAAAASAVVAAEPTEGAVLEALALLEQLAGDAAGEQALSASGEGSVALTLLA